MTRQQFTEKHDMTPEETRAFLTAAPDLFTAEIDPTRDRGDLVYLGFVPGFTDTEDRAWDVRGYAEPSGALRLRGELLPHRKRLLELRYSELALADSRFSRAVLIGLMLHEARKFAGNEKSTPA